MAPEVQGHGLKFEEWIRDTFFNSYKAASYTGKWDISADSNMKHGGIPVSVKTAEYGHSIGLGDALRQFNIDEDFLMIVGFWRQEDEKKRIVNIVAAPIKVELWRSLWHPITLDDLSHLDSTIKSQDLTPQKARKEAQLIKKQPPFTKARISVNPKIDTKTQRRLQCTLRFSTLFSEVAPDADRQAVNIPKLFGVEALEAFLSNPRTFKRKFQISE